MLAKQMGDDKQTQVKLTFHSTHRLYNVLEFAIAVTLYGKKRQPNLREIFLKRRILARKEVPESLAMRNIENDFTLANQNNRFAQR